MRRERNAEEGVIALEASIALSLFIFLMLMLYSFFIVFESQYSIEHAILEAAKSMSLETYATEKIVKSDGTEWGYLKESGSIGKIVEEIGLQNGVKNPDYVAYTRWYEDESQTVEMAKKRFCAYFAGGKEETDELLKKMRVKDGLDGLDFSGTAVTGDDLAIAVTYTNRLIFDYPAFHMGEITLRLSAKSSLWK